MEDSITPRLEWHPRNHGRRKVASVRVYEGERFVFSSFGYYAPGETDDQARERAERVALARFSERRAMPARCRADGGLRRAAG